MFTNTTPDVIKSISKYYVLSEQSYQQAINAGIDSRYVNPEYESEHIEDVTAFINAQASSKTPKNYVILGLSTSPRFTKHIAATDRLKAHYVFS